jgi:predicted tellurium resistance membrane protein TerC
MYSCGLGFYQYIFNFLTISSVVFLAIIGVNLWFRGYYPKMILPTAVVFLMFFSYCLFSAQNNFTKFIERIDPACSSIVPRL